MNTYDDFASSVRDLVAVQILSMWHYIGEAKVITKYDGVWPFH